VIRPTLISAMLLLAAFSAMAEPMQIEIVPLQHRTTDEVIPIVRPLLAEGGTVAGMNNQLILKTTAQNLAEIKQVIAGIDTAPRRLLITVRQDMNGSASAQDRSVGGTYAAGDVTVRGAERRPAREGVSVSAGDDDGNSVQLNARDRSVHGSDRNAYQVQTLEGQPAFIEAGQSVPLPNRTSYIRADGVLVQDTVEFHDATSGFYVLPRLSGDTVTLLVSPHMSRLDSAHGRPVFDIQNVQTTASGRLGQWITLGGIDTQSRHDADGMLSSRREQRRESRSILIKVEELP
jgi:Bacterial type II and III secretion system protein/Bacterial type II/III secretion system short domain